MFAYPCPSCRQRLLATIGRVGQRSICPKCLHPLTVPHPEQAVAGGPFTPAGVAQEPSSHEPNRAAGARAEAVEGRPDTPAPMHTVPARTGEFFELDRAGTVTEHFLELPPVVFTPPPTEVAVPPTGPPVGPSKPPAPAVPATRPARPPHEEQDGRVTFDTPDPTAHVAAQLSPTVGAGAALGPVPGDVSVVGGWVVGTLAGLMAGLLGVWPAPGLLAFAAVVGVAMVAFGVLWRAYLCGREGTWAKGLLALLPPVCLLQLVRPAAGVGLRPLWFVLSGVGLLGLFVVGHPVKRWVDGTSEAKKAGPPPAEVTPPDPDAVAPRLESRADREEAKRALVRAGAAAEPAVRKLLAAKADGTVIAACDVLAEIGTADSLPALRKLADDTASKAVRVEAAAAADEIEKRVGGKK